MRENPPNDNEQPPTKEEDLLDLLICFHKYKQKKGKEGYDDSERW